jgi:hypothetical protein
LRSSSEGGVDQREPKRYCDNNKEDLFHCFISFCLI